MKIWIKILVGSILGILLAILFPDTFYGSKDYLAFAAEITINIGRYMLFPLIFFSLAQGVHQLRKEKKLINIVLRTFIYMVLSAAVLAILGTLIVIVAAPSRIPMIITDSQEINIAGVGQLIRGVFPSNLFTVFTENTNYLLPLYVMAFFLGLHFAFDEKKTAPALKFFESMTDIVNHANRFIAEIMGLGMVVLASFFVIKVNDIIDIDLFRELLVVLAVTTGIVILMVYPLLLFFLGGRKNPFKWLYAIIAPALSAFFSGDIYFGTAILMKHGEKNLGVPRRVGAVSFPVLSMFGKAGTALVAAVSFIVVFRSYSSLDFNLLQVFWVMLFSFLVSFALPAVPGISAFAAVYILCTLYGKGIEEGFLLLSPIAPLLVSFATLLDIVNAAFVTHLAAYHGKLHEEISIGEFV